MVDRWSGRIETIPRLYPRKRIQTKYAIFDRSSSRQPIANPRDVARGAQAVHDVASARPVARGMWGNAPSLLRGKFR
jgi:hypothetical protein